jgi:hypothetical protein
MSAAADRYLGHRIVGRCRRQSSRNFSSAPTGPYVDDIFGAPLAIEGLAAAARERHVHANFLPDDKIDADD